MNLSTYLRGLVPGYHFWTRHQHNSPLPSHHRDASKHPSLWPNRKRNHQVIQRGLDTSAVDDTRLKSHRARAIAWTPHYVAAAHKFLSAT